MSLDTELEKWDPMRDDFYKNNKYENHLGKGLENRQSSSGVQIILRHLPQGITTEGIRNLCLSAGEPVEVRIFSNGTSAFVKFDKLKEGELLLRDLHNTPPYYLKVSFPKQCEKGNNTDEDCASGSQLSSNKTEKWKYETFDKSSLSKRIQSTESFKSQTCSVPPYFTVTSDFDNPSLVMRQRRLDFKSDSGCVAMGRGYLLTGYPDRYALGNKLFSFKSENWVDNEKGVRNCSTCGCLTFRRDKKYFGSYCSNQCLDGESSEQNKESNLNNNIFDFFAVGLQGVVTVLQKRNESRVPCCVVLDKKLDQYELITRCTKPPGEPIRAEVGDVVFADYSNRILRGVVLTVEDDFYKVSLIDYGIIAAVKYVYTISDDVRNIVAFNGIASYATELPSLDGVKFRVKRKKFFDSWLCDLIKCETNEVVGEITLEKWCSTSGLTYVPAESGCTVILSSFQDMKTLFVRRIDGSFDEEFVKFNNDVAAYSLEAPTYTNLPKCGELCCALYKNDGCYYRAVVRTVKRKSVTVFFVDYGNEQETEVNDLRYLPSSAWQMPCFAVRVRLDGVSSVSSPRMVHYFNNLTANKVELQMYYDNENLSKVTLVEKTSGSVVNKILTNMAVPTWVKDPSVFNKSGEICFVEAIEELSFDVNETVDIFVLHFDADELSLRGSFWATHNRTDYLCHLNQELKQNITEYCSYLTEDSYLPRPGELCLVELEGEWHRGLAINENEEDCYIFLIDRGISSKFERKNVRKIIKEFLELPALALECRIADFDSLNENLKPKLIEYMRSVDKKVVKGAKVVKNSGKVYHLSLPFVSKLME